MGLIIAGFVIFRKEIISEGIEGAVLQVGADVIDQLDDKALVMNGQQRAG